MYTRSNFEKKATKTTKPISALGNFVTSSRVQNTSVLKDQRLRYFPVLTVMTYSSETWSLSICGSESHEGENYALCISRDHIRNEKIC
ncbi:jg12570 [Pararge aegeria aegeria]|uniref:Jg12570 protein n=1 Tax=Pararge aegeria aegeria TaxID=348720 RepID=A0A8S4SA41_9NEOP|nr:jg12570 [Pararge aegeria aegeria]